MNGMQGRQILAAEELDFNSVRTVDLYPYEAVEMVINAMEKAEKEGDLESLKWCARRMIWFFDMAETSEVTISPKQAGKLFCLAYLGSDSPPPALIAKMAV